MSDSVSLESKIEAALEGVTEGPWEADIDREAVATERDLEMVARVHVPGRDALFIAQSRQLLPDALAELRRLQAELDDRPPKGQHAALIVRLSDASAERDAALAQVEELEGALRAWVAWAEKNDDYIDMAVVSFQNHGGVKYLGGAWPLVESRRVLNSEEQTPEVSP